MSCNALTFLFYDLFSYLSLVKDYRRLSEVTRHARLAHNFQTPPPPGGPKMKSHLEGSELVLGLPGNLESSMQLVFSQKSLCVRSFSAPSFPAPSGLIGAPSRRGGLYPKASPRGAERGGETASVTSF